MLIMLLVAFALLTTMLLVLQFLQRHTQQQLLQQVQRINEQSATQLEATRSLQQSREEIHLLLDKQTHLLQQQREQLGQLQVQSLQTLQESISKAMQEVRAQISLSLQQHAELLNHQIRNLIEETKTQLQQISGEVNKQLNHGFEKTTATFTDIVKRLTIIDQAQQKITELSSNVVGLQEILADKRSRGAFGEVQLNHLIQNMIPEKHYALQHTLSNGKRADCILFLPDPTGNIVIDSKFPLETYRQIDTCEFPSEQKKLIAQFKQDIRKHISDIAEKYIVPGETADGAVMFIPAEAIFAEIHAHYSELVEFAYQKRVWLVSPTTMMAILTTARAVLKDAATRQQVHIIQEHLVMLSKDFERFQTRMDNLSKHIEQAHQDVEEVHKSSQKISNRFQKIEKVDLDKVTQKEKITMDLLD